MVEMKGHQLKHKMKKSSISDCYLLFREYNNILCI